MATIIRRTGKNGQPSFRAQVRLKGKSPLSATFLKVSDARKWVQVTEAAILEGRHLPTPAAKRHTLTDLIDRYLCCFVRTSSNKNPQHTPAPPRREVIHQVHKRLQSGGFKPGAVDGAIGPQTREALRWFQNTQGLRPTGKPDEATLDVLGVR